VGFDANTGGEESDRGKISYGIKVSKGRLEVNIHNRVLGGKQSHSDPVQGPGLRKGGGRRVIG